MCLSEPFNFKKLLDFTSFLQEPVRLGNRTYRAWGEERLGNRTYRAWGEERLGNRTYRAWGEDSIGRWRIEWLCVSFFVESFRKI